jgi:gliding motility-associated-like protein
MISTSYQRALRSLILHAIAIGLSVTVWSQTSDVAEGCIPLQVNFTAPVGQSSFFWEFGDGVTSTLQNPSHLYTSEGSYLVVFRNTPGGDTIGTLTIQAYERPEILIDIDPLAGCPGLEITLTDVTGYIPELEPINRQWTFGDGGVGNGQSVTHTYTAPGAYNVSFGVSFTLSSCNTTVLIEPPVEIYDPPVASFTTDPMPPVVCDPPLTVSFTNTSTGVGPLTIEWDMGNGFTFSGANPPPQTYTESGNFLVRLTLTDANGCTATQTATVSTGPGALDISLRDSVCIGQFVTPQNLAPAGFHLWTGDPGVTFSNVNARNPQITFPNIPGVYNVSYTWTSQNQQCSTDTTFVIQVLDNAFTYTRVDDPEVYCGPPFIMTFIPDPLEGVFSWDIERFGVFDTPTVEIDVDEDPFPFSIYGRREFRVSINYQTPWGCSGSLDTVEVLRVTTAAFIPENYGGCFDHEVKFIDLSYSPNIVRWTWDFGDGNTFSHTEPLDSVPHIYTECGVFEVTLTIEDANGCVSTSYPIEIRICGDCDGGIGFCDCIFSIPPGSTLCHGDTLFYTITASEGIRRFRLEGDGDRLFHCSEEGPGEWDYFWVFGHEPGAQTLKLFWETNEGNRDSLLFSDYFTLLGAWARPNYKIECEDPYTVHFQDSSMNANRIEWLFPDGTIYNEDAFSHTFTDTGDYLIYLTAWNDVDGCPPNVDSVWVYIRDIEAHFELPEEICQGQMLELDASGSRDVNNACHKGYKWTFSDGPRPQVLDDPLHEVFLGVPCENIVTLTVTDINGCASELSKSINVQAVTAVIELDVDRVCLPATIQPVAVVETECATLEDINWLAGLTSASGPNPTITIPEGTPVINGIIPIVLTATTALGCPAAASFNLSVYEPVSEISTMPTPPVICPGESVVFSATDFTEEGSFLNFDWNFGDGQTSNAQEATVTYPNPGVYEVRLIFTEDATGCSGQRELAVTVQSLPEASFSSSVDNLTTICHPQQILFENTSSSEFPLTQVSWNPGNGGPDVTQQDQVGFAYGKGSFTITLTVATSAGCTDVAERTFTLVGPEGSIALDKDVVCLGDPITFSLQDTSDVGSWTWFIEGLPIFDENPVTHVYESLPSSGLTFVKLIVSDSEGICTFADSIPVPIVRTDFELFGDTICLGQTGVIGVVGALPGSTLTWSPGATVLNQGQPQTGVNPTQTTVYTLEAIHPAGCVGTAQAVVVVIQPPSWPNWDTAVAVNKPIVLPGPGGDGLIYNWEPEEGLSCTACQEPTFVSDSIGEYTYVLTVTDVAGCFVTDIIYTIEVYPDMILLPNLFTPNGDGLNDFFQIVLPPGGRIESDIAVIRMKVFNRWGQVVYNNDSPDTGWDGNYKGKPAPMDTYAYVVEVEFFDGRVELLRGDITLVR